VYDGILNFQNNTPAWVGFIGTAQSLQDQYKAIIVQYPRCTCQAICSQPGARGAKVDVSIAVFQSAVTDYIQDNGTSKYGYIIRRWDIRKDIV
jgi:hypothetical protein